MVRERLGLRPGQVLDVTAEEGSIVLTKRLPDDAFASVVGIVELDRSSDQAIEELRGPVEEP